MQTNQIGRKFSLDCRLVLLLACFQVFADEPRLEIVWKNLSAFRDSQSIYLDGAAHDEFSANIGAEKIFEVLRARAALCTFYESPGKHSEHVQERLERGLAWIFERPLPDIN